MRGYFGIGIEGVSKAINAGNLLRTAHAFGASFFFTVAANCDVSNSKSDTSFSAAQMPFYPFDNIEAMRLPKGCVLIGIEIDNGAIELPSFRHPRCAAYVLGMERYGLSEEMVKCCEQIVKIPTQFSLNLATAGGIVMYDRALSTRRFSERPLMAGAKPVPLQPHMFGEPIIRKRNSKS
tara:strand:+ start:624 stop:1160 length:537 start_codon:yes stop_codon:yes gene_type:complete